MYENYIPGFTRYLRRAVGGSVSTDELLEMGPDYEALAAAQPVYEQPAVQNIASILPELAAYYGVPVEQLLAPVEQPVYSAPAEQPVYSAPVEQPVYSTPAEQPVYSAPAEQPVYSAPAEQPVYSAPAEQPAVQNIASILPELAAYYGVPVEQLPAPAEQPVYSAPAEQPVYSTPAEQPVYSAPAEQPAAASTVDLGDWNLANFQNQFMQNDASAALTDFIGKQAAQGKLYTSPIGDSLTTAGLMPGAMSGLLSLYGATPEEQALRYFRFQGRDQQSGTTANPIVMRDEYTGGYRLVDDKTGEVLGTASNAEQLEALLGRAAEMRGAKDIYSLQALGPEGNVVDTLYQQKAKETLGDLLVQMGALALPAAGGAVLGPLLSGALGSSAAVGTGLGTALGSAASGVTAGKSIGDILKQAAIAGVTAGGLQALAGGPAAGSKVPGLAADLQTKVLDGVMSVADAGKALANAGATSAQIAKFAADVGGGISGAVPTVIGNVLNTAANIAPVAGGTLGALTGALSSAGGAQPPAATVVGQRPITQPTIPAPVAPIVTGALDLAAPPATTVVGQQPTTQPTEVAPVAPVVTGALDLAAPPATTVVAERAPQPAEVAPVAPVVTGALDLAAPPATTVVGQRPTTPQETAAPVVAPVVAPDLTPPAATVIGEKVAPVEDRTIATPTKLAFDAAFSDIPAPGTEAPAEPEIVVSKRNEPVIPPSIIPSTIASVAPSLNAPTTTPPAETPKKGLFDDLSLTDYMQLAGLAIGGLGSLFGKGGQQPGARISGGMGSLPSVFSAKLPGANLPGLAAGTSGPRTAADLGAQGLRTPQDYYRYGYGPEQSFFNYVPQGAPNTSTAYTGYAKGGEIDGPEGGDSRSFAVQGPGDGREDKIPALLSDGEYVMDAETVALLGNGSNKAGAEKLDKFRVNVRKHKGRDLMRGEFSKNAKRPERYLAGGRA